MKSPVIHIEGLEIGYRDKSGSSVQLLPPIELALYEGDFIALMGPNGAGKSTLLRTLAGMHSPLSGKIFLKNKDIARFDKREMSKMVGIVLTDRIDDFFLTVYDVVCMGRYPYTGFWGELKPNDHEIVMHCLQMVGMQNLAKRTMLSLSDGERQKVMIAKALAQDTPIIMLDEPAAFLDYPSKIELMHLLQQLAHEDGKTILFSSHDLELALSSADRLWLLGRDKVVQDGIPEQLILDGFIGDYFNRSDLHFNAESGKFFRSKPAGISVQIKGEGIRAYWMKQAVLRKGYSISDKLSNIQILISSKGLSLLIDDKERIFTTKLEPILHELQQI